MKKIVLGMVLAGLASAASAEPIKLYKDFTYGQTMTTDEAYELERSLEPVKIGNCEGKIDLEFTKKWELEGLPNLTEETYKNEKGEKLTRLVRVSINVTLCDPNMLLAMLKTKYGEPVWDTGMSITDNVESWTWVADRVKIRFGSYIGRHIAYEPIFEYSMDNI
jgi:hypothetical protein